MSETTALPIKNLTRQQKDFRIYQYSTLRSLIADEDNRGKNLSRGHILVKDMIIYREVLAALVFAGFYIYEYEEDFGQKTYRISFTEATKDQVGKYFSQVKDAMPIENFHYEEEDYLGLCASIFYKEIEPTKEAMTYKLKGKAKQEKELEELLESRENMKQGFALIKDYEIFQELVIHLKDNGFKCTQYELPYGLILYRLVYN